MQPPSPFFPRYAQMLPPQAPTPTTPPPMPPTYTSPHYVYPSSYPSYQSPMAYPSYVSPQMLPPHLSPPLPIHSNIIPPQAPMYASPPMRASGYGAHANVENCERDQFYRKLHAFRDSIGEPIQRLPTLGFKELDLWVLYKEVIKRRGIDAVIAKKQWKEVAEALQLPSSCTDSGFRLRLHYKKYLEAFERKFFEAPAIEAKDRKPKRGGSVTSSAVTVPEEGTISNGSCRSEGESWKEGNIRGVRKKKRSGRKEEEDKGKEEKDTKDEKREVSEEGDAHMTTEKEVQGRMEERGGRESNKNIGRNIEGNARSRDDGANVQDGVIGVEKVKPSVSEKAAERLVENRISCERLSLLQAAALAGEKRGISKSRKCGKVDFSVLESATLKRYARHHGVNEGEGKSNLADSVSRHFETMPLRDGETATLLQFIQAVRRR